MIDEKGQKDTTFNQTFSKNLILAKNDIHFKKFSFFSVLVSYFGFISFIKKAGIIQQHKRGLSADNS
jgi:hypothetical protein